MRLLLVHNYYQQSGGEDAVFAAETTLLRQNGHEVVEYMEDNHRIDGMNRIALGTRTIWSRPTQQRLRELFRTTRCDVAHFHNTFPLVSPSAYYACQEAGVPVVQTLHNYRLLCPAATFFRNGQVCESCLDTTVPWPGILHACYRNSRPETSVVAAMLSIHRWLRTWKRRVDCYIALTEFSREKFVQGGLPGEKIVVKPNFVYPDPGKRESRGDYALFVGRLTVEKGLWTLLRAWEDIDEIPLKIAGDGPLLKEVTQLVRERGLQRVEVLGRQPRDQVLALMKGAQFLVFPSEWYEGFPMTVAEAFACGVPVIVGRLGAMAEIVEENRTGLLFNPQDREDLQQKVRWAAAHPDSMIRMGESARQVYEEKYSSEKNYRMLMDIYERTAVAMKGALK